MILFFVTSTLMVFFLKVANKFSKLKICDVFTSYYILNGLNTLTCGIVHHRSYWFSNDTFI